MTEFEVVINTPQKQAYSGSAVSVNAPAAEGYMTVMAGHAPLLSKLSKGNVTVKTPTETKEFEINEGFIEINKNSTTLLVK